MLRWISTRKNGPVFMIVCSVWQTHINPHEVVTLAQGHTKNPEVQALSKELQVWTWQDDSCPRHKSKQAREERPWELGKKNHTPCLLVPLEGIESKNQQHYRSHQAGVKMNWTDASKNILFEITNTVGGLDCSWYCWREVSSTGGQI